MHPDNVKRTNDRLAAQQLQQLHDLALQSHVVAIFCGLDWTRGKYIRILVIECAEFSTRFAQEKLLESHLQLAQEIRLPVVVSLTGNGSTERLCELVQVHHAKYNVISEDATPVEPDFQLQIVIHAFVGTIQELDLLVANGFYIR